MPASPRYRIYSKHGSYLAAVSEPDAALRAVSYVGEPGTMIRVGTRNVTTVWREGSETVPASDLTPALAIVAEREDRARKGLQNAYRKSKRDSRRQREANLLDERDKARAAKRKTSGKSPE